MAGLTIIRKIHLKIVVSDQMFNLSVLASVSGRKNKTTASPGGSVNYFVAATLEEQIRYLLQMN